MTDEVEDFIIGIVSKCYFDHSTDYKHADCPPFTLKEPRERIIYRTKVLVDCNLFLHVDNILSTVVDYIGENLRIMFCFKEDTHLLIRSYTVGDKYMQLKYIYRIEDLLEGE